MKFKFNRRIRGIKLVVILPFLILLLLFWRHFNSKKSVSTSEKILVIGQVNDSISDWVFSLGNNNIQKLARIYPNAVVVVAVKAQSRLDEIFHWECSRWSLRSLNTCHLKNISERKISPCE